MILKKKRLKKKFGYMSSEVIYVHDTLKSNYSMFNIIAMIKTLGKIWICLFVLNELRRWGKSFQMLIVLTTLLVYRVLDVQGSSGFDYSN